MSHDEAIPLNQEETRQLLGGLADSAKDIVKQFNKDERHRNLPRAIFWPNPSGFQVYRTRTPNVFNLPEPSRRSLNWIPCPDLGLYEIRVDEVTIARYKRGRDDDGKPVFHVLDGNETFTTPEKIVQEIILPFLEGD